MPLPLPKHQQYSKTVSSIKPTTTSTVPANTVHSRANTLDGSLPAPCSERGLSFSVQSLDPILRYGTGWTRSRLVLGVVTGRGKFRPGGVLVGLEVPEPLLAGLEALNVAMATVPEVGARVLARRGVAASDVPALRAPSQMEPPAGWV